MYQLPENARQDVSKIADYLKRHETEKKIRVYFLRGTDTETDKSAYFYLVASALLHDRMLQCLRDGAVPDFAVVIAKGYGEPDQDTKDKVKHYYGYEHAVSEDDENTSYFN